MHVPLSRDAVRDAMPGVLRPAAPFADFLARLVKKRAVASGAESFAR
jgi:hypothetical protein